MNTTIVINIACIAVITANAVFVLSRWSPKQLSPWLQLGIFSPFLFAMGNLGTNLYPHHPAAYDLSLQLLYSGLIWTVTSWWLVTVRLASMQGMRWRLRSWLWAKVPILLAFIGWIIAVTNPWHGLFLTPVPGTRSEYGVLWYANGGFLWLLILCTVLLSVYRHRSAEFASDRAQMRLCGLSSALPTLLNATYTLAPTPVQFDPTVVGLAISTSMLVYAIYRGQLHAASTVRLEEWIGSDPVAGILVDRNGRALFSNEAVQRLFGASPGNEPVAPWIESRLIDGHRDTAAESAPDGLHQVRARPELWVELEKRPVRLDGATVGSVWFIHDETQRRQLDATLHAARQVESLGLIAGGVAHDFNNLLVSINGNAELGELFADTEPARVKEYLARIRRAGEQGADLARQLLTYAGKGQVVLGDVDINRVVESTTDMLRSSLRGSVDVVVNLADEPPHTVADSTQIAQVLLNLIINAEEAIGARDGTIHVSTGRSLLSRTELDAMIGAEDVAPGHFVFIRVGDDGPGIAPDTLPRIFDPFFSTKAVGRGLGLASTLGAIRKHHGCCQVTSTPGKGSTFTVFLPDSGTDQSTVVDSGHIETGSWKGRSALILDDNAAVSSVLGQMLAHLGFEVVDATGSLATALQHARTCDLAVVDLTMPGHTIEKVLEDLRRTNPLLPLIVISGFDSRELPNTGSGFLQKPFSLAGLTAAIAGAYAGSPPEGIHRASHMPFG